MGNYQRLEVVTVFAKDHGTIQSLLRRFHCDDQGRALVEFNLYGVTKFIGYEYRGQTKEYHIRKGTNQ